LKNSSSKTNVCYECIRILREIDEKEIFAQELISEKCSQVDWLPHPDKNPSVYMAANYSHPEWLIKRWLSRYGKEKAIEICKINNLPPKVFLRINQRKISPQEFIELLGKNVISSYTIDNAVVVDNIAVSEIPGFSQGLFFVQDISAMKVAQFLKVEKSNAVLDMCAAPGGKTTHIAELLRDTGKVCALNISLKRLQLVQENCQRMGGTGRFYRVW